MILPQHVDLTSFVAEGETVEEKDELDTYGRSVIRVNFSGNELDLPHAAPTAAKAGTFNGLVPPEP